MADGVFNIAKGAVIEKFRDGAANGGILLLQANQAEASLVDHATVSAMLGGGNTEATFTNYARKTGLTGTITIDNTNNWITLDLVDQTWTSAGGATNNTLTKAIIYYEESASDLGRIPLVHLDFAVVTSGANLTIQFNAAGVYRAQ